MLRCCMVPLKPACILWWSSPLRCCGCSVEGEGTCEPGSCAGQETFPADGQPPPWTVAEGRTSRMGALTKMGNGERDLGGRITSACLGSTIHPPTPASPFLWQSVLAQLILLPARAFKALKAQNLVGLLQGDTLRAVGRTIPFKGKRWALPTGPLENRVWRGVCEHGTGLLAVPLHLPSSASTAAHHSPLPLLSQPMHCSPVASPGFGRVAKASCPDTGQERWGTGQICLSALSYIASLMWPLKRIT